MVEVLIGAGVGFAVGFTLSTIFYVLAVEHGMVGMQEPGSASLPSVIATVIVLASGIAGALVAARIGGG